VKDFLFSHSRPLGLPYDPNMSVCVLCFVFVSDSCFWFCWNLVWRTFYVVKVILNVVESGCAADYECDAKVVQMPECVFLEVVVNVCSVLFPTTSMYMHSVCD
jgi:hypothetical protein